jgi:cobalt-zinc-cadmium resistance protein CzcA
MLNTVIDWSLRHRFIVVGVAVAFVTVGFWAWSELPIDAFPDTTPVQVQINTFAPGLAPVTVERQITVPVERAVAGMPRLTQMRSVSKFGLSQVVVTFEDGTDIYFARQLVNERLSTANIPQEVQRPTMGPVATGLGEVFHYIVTSKKRSLREVRTLQDWVIRPALRSVPGTAEINVWGGHVKQYQARVDPALCLKYGVTLDQVLVALQQDNLTVGGGNLEQSGEMYLVQGLAKLAHDGKAADPAELEEKTRDKIRKVVVTTPRAGAPVYLRDVADVKVGDEIRLGGVTAQGRGEGVLGLGFMLMGENSHAVTGRLKTRLEEVEKTLPPDVEVRTVYDRSQLVDQVLDTVRKNLFEGGILVVAVLFIFLGRLRAGLIVALAIPISMLFAFSGMLRFGIAGSLLSLGAIDFGLIVDSSVVMVENVVRRLAHERDPSRTQLEIVRDAAIEVRTPTMFGELIIMIVYLPILTLEGVEGKLFRPMALTVIFALLGSLVMSLTLMPALASLLLPRRMEEEDPWLVRLARWIYAPVLRFAMRHGVAVLLFALTALLGGVMVARGLGSEFVPRLSEGALTLTVFRLPGTDLEESLRYNSEMERLILEKFPSEVANVWSRTGTAEVATDPMGPEETDFFITLKPRSQWRPEIASQAELTEEIKKTFNPLPGQKVLYSQPIEQRMNEMISGVKTSVVVKLFGDDFEQLQDKAEEIAAALRTTRGAADVSIDQVAGQSVLQIQVKQDQLARYGMTAKTVMDVVESLGNKPLSEVEEGQLRFALVVRLPEKRRSSPEAIRAILITTPSGARVQLSELAEIEVVKGQAKIPRESSQRLLAIQCNVPERDVGGFVDEARRRVDAIKMPSSRYHVEWGGQFENLERGKRRLMIVVPVALVLIFVLLYVTYNRLADVLLVFVAVPFAGVGGVLALWLRELPFSISAGVGFIALSGVSVLNSMVLVTFIRQLRDRGVPLDKAIEEAALTRLRPVLMTALVASLGFVPMALSTGVGAEVQRPLATVVIGGVLSSTMLTLLVLPVLYHFFGPRRVTVRKEQELHHEEPAHVEKVTLSPV